MHLPARIRVSGQDYSVQVVDGSTDTHIDDLYGYCNHRALKIALNSNYAHRGYSETLIHEVVHAINSAIEEEPEEKDHARFCRALFSVFADNPSLLEYVLEEIKGKL